jgi:hypothetical protein
LTRGACLTYEIRKSWLGLYLAVVFITFVFWFDSLMWACIPEDVYCIFWGPIIRICAGLFLSMFIASRAISIKKVDPWFGRLITGVSGNLLAYFTIVIAGLLAIHPDTMWDYLLYHRYLFPWYVGVPISVWILWCMLGWLVQYIGLVPRQMQYEHSD